MSEETLYAKAEPEVEFFSTGAQVLDNVLGKGWAVSRLINIQGDSSSGKTLLAEEAIANHLAKWPNGKIWYVDAEATFQESYATNIGIDTSKIEFIEGVYTIEDWFCVLEEINSHIEAAEKAKVSKKKPKKAEVTEEDDAETPIKGSLKLIQSFEVSDDFHGLMILDSIDALSDEAEMERDIRDGSFGAAKAKKFSEAFRRINAKLSSRNVTIIGISQLRDSMSMAGKVRSGGRAIEFYSSQVVRLKETFQNSKIKKTIGGIERIVGLRVEASCNKNKVGRPHRKGVFQILFDYGIDDITSNLEWMADENPAFLAKVTPVGDVSLVNEKGVANINLFMKRVFALSNEEHKAKRREVAELTKQAWDEIESRFDVNVQKY